MRKDTDGLSYGKSNDEELKKVEMIVTMVVPTQQLRSLEHPPHCLRFAILTILIVLDHYRKTVCSGRHC